MHYSLYNQCTEIKCVQSLYFLLFVHEHCSLRLYFCQCPHLTVSPVFCCRPNLIDMNKVYRQTNLENLEQAFSVAERDLGVTRLLDPEGKNSPLDSPSRNFDFR